MKISDLKIDAFGVWRGLYLEDLSGEIDVVYGPNEAGKTTLLQFIRAVLYGFSPERRARYLPPVAGGTASGTLCVEGPEGTYEIVRQDDAHGDPAGKLTIRDESGDIDGAHWLANLLGNVDEQVFNNVFALGLSELAQLATLNDTEVGEHLFRLASGVDRVSLVEVLGELEASRNRIYAPGAKQSQVARLLRRREQLRREIKDLDTLTLKYTRLLRQREQLQNEIAENEQQVDELEDKLRVLDTAASVRDLWQQRAEVDEFLASVGPLPKLPEDSLTRLEKLNAIIDKRAERVEKYKQERKQIREEAELLKPNEALLGRAPRIEALEQQQTWISTLQSKVDELAAEVSALENQIELHKERLQIETPTTSWATHPPSLQTLHRAARSVRKRRSRWKKALQAVKRSKASSRDLQQQIQQALEHAEEKDLRKACKATSRQVARLRKLVQLEEKEASIDRQLTELSQDCDELLDKQMLPGWAIFAAASVFGLGVLLLLATLLTSFVPDGLAWALSILGLLGMVFTVAGKFVWEQSNQRQLNSREKQVETLKRELADVRGQKEKLHEELPATADAAATRLAEAEAELARLENLLPLDTRRKSLSDEAKESGRRVKKLEKDYRRAASRYRKALIEVGLPEKTSPVKLRDYTEAFDTIRQLQQRLTSRQEELANERRSLVSVATQIGQVFDDIGAVPAAKDPRDQLRELCEKLRQERQTGDRRKDLARQMKHYRKLQTKAAAKWSEATRKRQAILREAGAENEEEFRKLAERLQEAWEFRSEREKLERQIATAIGGICTQQTLEQEFAGKQVEHLDARRRRLKEALDACREHLEELFEKRGEMNEQLRRMAADRQVDEKHLELVTLEANLEKARDRWQTLGMTSLMLKKVRHDYEQNRQPETLQEASQYLERLSEGNYRRVWTPLDEERLLVDDPHGNTLTIELLSRGTREQLFLALRLALASWFGRHGIHLPLVMDDLLVNFDNRRAKAAASLLRDYARDGHQLIVFTCHEHIVKLFKSMKVPVRELPDRLATALEAKAEFETAGTVATSSSQEWIDVLEHADEIAEEEAGQEHLPLVTEEDEGREATEMDTVLTAPEGPPVFGLDDHLPAASEAPLDDEIELIELDEADNDFAAAESEAGEESDVDESGENEDAQPQLVEIEVAAESEGEDAVDEEDEELDEVDAGEEDSGDEIDDEEAIADDEELEYEDDLEDELEDEEEGELAEAEAEADELDEDDEGDEWIEEEDLIDEDVDPEDEAAEEEFAADASEQDVPELEDDDWEDQTEAA